MQFILPNRKKDLASSLAAFDQGMLGFGQNMRLSQKDQEARTQLEADNARLGKQDARQVSQDALALPGQQLQARQAESGLGLMNSNAEIADFGARQSTFGAGPLLPGESARPTPLIPGKMEPSGSDFLEGKKLAAVNHARSQRGDTALTLPEYKAAKVGESDKLGREKSLFDADLNHKKAQTGLLGAQTAKTNRESTVLGQPKARELKAMTQGELDDLTLVETAAKTMNDIQGAFGEISSAKKGPFLGRLAGANPYDVSVQKLNKLIDSITPALARGVFREVGVLTDKDMDRYKTLLPQAKTDPKVAEEVFRDLQKKIQDTYSISIKNMGVAGRDISGFDPDRNLFEQKSVGSRDFGKEYGF